MDFSTTELRVFREVAERGTFTAAAGSLGYTQSAVSRQVAGLEATVGTTLFERRRTGVSLTVAGRRLLPYAVRVLETVDAAESDLHAGTARRAGRVRLGAFPSAGPGLVVPAVAALRRDHPSLQVFTRDGSTPALVRALRSGAIDLAVLASSPPFRAFDDLRPALRTEVLAENDLRVAVPVNHPFGDVVDVADLAGQRWIASRSGAGENTLGVWPGLAERQVVAHITQEWLTKLALVAAGCGITSMPTLLRSTLPPACAWCRCAAARTSVAGSYSPACRATAIPTASTPRSRCATRSGQVLVPTDDRG